MCSVSTRLVHLHCIMHLGNKMDMESQERRLDWYMPLGRVYNGSIILLPHLQLVQHR